MALLEIRGLTKYFGGLGALVDLDLDVKPLEMMGVIGPNGAGKSTLFNLIAGTHLPTSGQVIFDGQDITGLKPHQIAQAGIGRTFQSSTLLRESSVLDNVVTAFHLHYKTGVLEAFLHTKAAREDEQNIKKKAMDILEFTGLVSQQNKIAGTLSSGYQKILAVAIAFATQPKLLLLDEPVTTLSVAMVEKVMSLIDKVRSTGTTVIIIEHNMKVIMDYCDRIVVIAYGKKLAEGTAKAICDDEEVCQAYLGVMD